MNIHSMNKHALEDLQSQIAQRIREIDQEERDRTARKNSVRNKTMIKQLTKDDCIFGISFNNDGDPVRMGVCDVLRIEVDEKWPEFYNVNIKHKTLPIGIYNYGLPLERGDKHYAEIARTRERHSREIDKMRRSLSLCYQKPESIEAVREAINA